jgi:hypothetical protein
MEVAIYIFLVIMFVIGVLVTWHKHKNKSVMEGMVSSASSTDLLAASKKLNHRLEQVQREHDSGTLTTEQYLSKLYNLSDDFDSSMSSSTTSSPSGGAPFQATKKYISGEHGIGIAFNSSTKKFALLSPYHLLNIDPEQIASVEVCVDSETLIITNKASLIGGAALGGILTGGFGAIVMALGAKKKQETNVKAVDLKIMLLGNSDPIRRIPFYGYTDRGSARRALQEAGEWHDLIKTAMEEASRRNVSINKSSQDFYSPSLLTEDLKKLVELHSGGLISSEEFQQAKRKLLR